MTGFATKSWQLLPVDYFRKTIHQTHLLINLLNVHKIFQFSGVVNFIKNKLVLYKFYQP